MNSRKASISHVMNDNQTTSDHHQSPSSGFSLSNILVSDDGPSHSQQHASSSQHSQHLQPPLPQPQYHHGVGNSNNHNHNNNHNNNGGYGGSYSNERDYHYSRSHQQQQPPTSRNHQEQNNQSSNSLDDSIAAEAGSILLLLSNQNTAPSPQQTTSAPYNNNQSRDYYPPKENELEAATAMSSLSNISNNIKSNSQQNNQRQRAMSIASLLGESASSESGHSMPSGSLMVNEQPPPPQQRYQQHDQYPDGDIHAHHHHHHHHQIQNQQNVDYNHPYNNLPNHNNNVRKHTKRPSGGSVPLMVNTKIPQREPKGIQKKSPQKRRPSDAVEFSRPKVHHRNPEPNHFSSISSGGPKLTDLREHLGEERNSNRMVPVIQNGPNHSMEWDRSQQHPQSYQNRPSQSEIPNPNRYSNNHLLSMSKNGISPPMHNDPQKLSKNYLMNSNERLLNKTSGPPVHAPNGHSVGIGGMVGTHPEVQTQSSQQPPPQMSPMPPIPMPPIQQNGQMPSIRGLSAFSNQMFHRKYYDMKHDPKIKRNATHAYIPYMIYTNQMENGKPKDGHLQSQTSPSQSHVMNRQTIPNGSPSISNDHGMVPQVNGNLYGSRNESHPSYPVPGNSAYVHSSEVANPGVQQRRVSDPPPHSHTNVNSRYTSTYVNASSAEQPLPPHTSHSRSISSHNSSPSLLPTHSSSINSSQRHVLSPISEPPHNRTSTTPSTSRSGSISHQQQVQTTLPPIQYNSSHHHHHNHPPNSHAPPPHHHHYLSQEHPNHQHHGHSHAHHYHQPVSQASQPPHAYLPESLTSRQYDDKSPPPPPPPAYMSGPPERHPYGNKTPPAPPTYTSGPRPSYNAKSSQAPVPQSPSRPPIQGSSTNPYLHAPSPGPLQNGSNRLSGLPHNNHHHHPPPSESAPSVNNNLPSSNSILSQPLTRFTHPHHPHTNGISGGHPIHLDGPPSQVLGPPVNGAGLGPRGAPNGYY